MHISIMPCSTTLVSGTPISSLPLASSVALSDTFLAVVTSGNVTTAQQITVSVLINTIAEGAGLKEAVKAAELAAQRAEAAAKETSSSATTDSNAIVTINSMRGAANGIAALDANGHLALSDGAKLVSVATVIPATQTTPALLSPDIPLSDQTQIGTDGVTLADLINRADALPSGTYYVDQNDIVRRARVVGSLPDDVVLNGDIYMAGASTLPEGLTSNGGVIMTDGSVYFTNTWNNNGVLCAAGV